LNRENRFTGHPVNTAQRNQYPHRSRQK
jgi:hypothetical protein